MSKPEASVVAPVAEKQSHEQIAASLVEDWVSDNLASSEFSAYTPAYNHFTASRADLVRRITEALKAK